MISATVTLFLQTFTTVYEEVPTGEIKLRIPKAVAQVKIILESVKNNEKTYKVNVDIRGCFELKGKIFILT